LRIQECVYDSPSDLTGFIIKINIKSNKCIWGRYLISDFKSWVSDLKIKNDFIFAIGGLNKKEFNKFFKKN
jgi:hypothetical protein